MFQLFNPISYFMRDNKFAIDNILSTIMSLLLFYAWLIAGSYFIFYFFNKNNRLGIILYGILYKMFVLNVLSFGLVMIYGFIQKSFG
ncbi:MULTISPECIES: hypothetical protein [unclassified Acinetobacter]|uniref:hypothetical protein n=1 Tax=unclassified Acinetobacter TaxID=196816 RepID=UPI0035BA644C